MEPLFWGGLGLVVGAVVGAVLWGAKMRRETATRYEQKLTAQFSEFSASYNALKSGHEAELKRLEEQHAKEKVAEYQRGRESDGVVRGAKGRMESVKPKTANVKAPAKARKYGEKVTGR